MVLKRNSPALIEQWFKKHDSDGEFARHERGTPYSVVGPRSSGGAIVFATKPSVLARAFEGRPVPEKLGLISGYGLPGNADLKWIRRLIGSRPMYYLGDMDPVDLMIFSWLRGRLRPKRVAYLGVNDALLVELRIRLSPTLTIPLAPSEMQSLPVLMQVDSTLAQTVGNQCATMLQRGYKIELEAVANSNGKSHRSLAAAIARLSGIRL